MELIDLVRTVRRYWVVALAAFGIVTGLGFFSIAAQPSKYRAEATLIVSPAPDQIGPGSTYIVSNAMPTLIARMESRSFYREAVALVPAAVRDASVSVSPSGDPGAGLLKVRAEGDEQDAVAPWANAFASQLVAINPNATVVLELLDPAFEPSSPVSSANTTTIVGIVVLAFIAAVLSALAVNALRGRDTGAEIRRRLGVEVLGEIPALGRFAERKKLRPADVFGDAELPSRVMEAYQALRADVELLVHSRAIEAIAVTSDAPSEGKSTVAANLSWALASVGHTVTLVDCDLRAPAIHSLFGFPAMTTGVSDVLTVPEDQIGELVRRMPLQGLAVVPAGVPSRHPSEILGPSLAKLLPVVSGPDRIVVVDSPPLEGIAESRTIAAMTRAVILVVDARKRRDFSDIERSVRTLETVGAELLGVVVNRSAVRRSKKASQYYHVRSARGDDENLMPVPQRFAQRKNAPVRAIPRPKSQSGP